MTILKSEFFMIPQHKNCFAYATSEYGMNILQQKAKGVYDFDVIQESLGAEIFSKCII